MSLGHFPGEDPDAAVQHGRDGPAPGRPSPTGCPACTASTSREMFQALWPLVPAEEMPIGSITNGVHGRTWVSSQMDDLFSKYVSPGVGRGRPRRVGPHRRRPRRRAVAGPGAGPRRPGQLRAGAAAQVAARPGRLGQRRGVDRRDPRPPLPDRRLLPPLRHLQAGHPAALPARPPARPAARRAAPAAAGLRRQGPPGRRPRQGDDRPDRAVLPGPGRAAPHHVHRGLRHLGGPHACTRAATCG